MANPAGSFIWYELMSPDPAASKQFYDAVVGWDIEPQPAGDLDYRMIRRAGGGNAGGVLKLDSAMQEHGARPQWFGYVNVDDVDASVAQATAAGGKAIMPPWSVPGIGRMAMVADPAGAALYLMRPEPPAGQPDATSDVFDERQPQHVGWNELATSDPATARSFYGDLFGWVTDDFMDMGPMGQYRFVDHAGRRIGAMAGPMPEPAARWRYYINVPSIAAAMAAVTANGGAITNGPHEVPGGMHIIIGTDPQGAEFALVGQQ